MLMVVRPAEMSWPRSGPFQSRWRYETVPIRFVHNELFRPRWPLTMPAIYPPCSKTFRGGPRPAERCACPEVPQFCVFGRCAGSGSPSLAPLRP